MNAMENGQELIAGHGTLISIRDVPRLLPPRPNGKRVHLSACYRWITRGVHGVTLEVVRIGGSTYTSHEALARFASMLSRRNGTPPNGLTSGHRRQQIERATARLKELLR